MEFLLGQYNLFAPIIYDRFIQKDGVYQLIILLAIVVVRSQIRQSL